MKFLDILRRRWYLAAGLLLVVAIALLVRPRGGIETSDLASAEVAEAAEGATPDSVVTLDSTSLRLAELEFVIVGNGGAGGLIANGTITYDANRVSVIAPRADGRVVQVRADLGQQVRAGTAVALLSSPEIGRTRGELERARANLEVARQNYERENRLYEQSISSQKEAIEAQGEYRSAQAEYNSALAQLRAYGATPGEDGTYAIVTPVSGTVVERNATPGQIAGPETDLFTIADLSRLWITVDVYESDLARVQNGAAAQVFPQALPGRSFPGHVTYAGGVVDPDSRTFKVRVAVDNPQLVLRPGMFAQVRIETVGAATSNAIVVPQLAIQDLNGEPVVFVVLGPGRFVARQVTLEGRTSGGLVTVAQGLRAGEQIVINGAFRLKAELIKGSFGEDED